MEELPVEIVGDILSRIADARDVVLASMACRKWRRAFRDHLRALSFRESDWGGFGGLSGKQMTALMSRTILQTTCLQSLTIDVRFHGSPMSIPAVMSWLMHTRRSLRELVFVVGDMLGMILPLKVVEIRGCEKLEKLTLAQGLIEGVDPNYHQFPSLRSLSLIECVRISGTDLRAFLSACPKLESLELIKLDRRGRVKNLEVVAPPSLRSFYLGETITDLDSLTFESAGVERLHLKLGELIQCFKFIGKGTLTDLAIEKTYVLDLDICDSAASLESIDIIEAKIAPSDLYRLISKSSNLRKLRLWDVSYVDWSEALDLETLALSCPQLSLLSLYCSAQVRKGFPYCLGGSTRFESMLYLAVGWSDSLEEEDLDEFVNLVEGLLDRCPSLRLLLISGLNDIEDGPRLGTPISRIRSKCADSDVQLVFD